MNTGRSCAVLLLAGAATGAAAEHEWTGRDTSRGSEIYAEACASCHGADLEGQPDWRSQGPDGTMPAPPHDAEGHTWHHDTRFLFTYTKLGGDETLKMMGVTGVQSGMPAFGAQLSDEDIMDVLAFIRSQWPQRQRDHQDRVSHGG